MKETKAARESIGRQRERERDQTPQIPRNPRNPHNPHTPKTKGYVLLQISSIERLVCTFKMAFEPSRHSKAHIRGSRNTYIGGGRVCAVLAQPIKERAEVQFVLTQKLLQELGHFSFHGDVHFLHLDFAHLLVAASFLHYAFTSLACPSRIARILVR